MKKFLLASFLVILSSTTFASSEETKEFIKVISNRDCSVILDILLERTVEANRLGLAAYTRLQRDEKDVAGNDLLNLSSKEFENSTAVKTLLIEKCFNH